MLVTPVTKAWPCGHLQPVPRGGVTGGIAHHAGAVSELWAGMSRP